MNELERLYSEIAELTLSECKKNCNALGSCCEPVYCELAMVAAREAGVELQPTTNKVMTIALMKLVSFLRFTGLTSEKDTSP